MPGKTFTTLAAALMAGPLLAAPASSQIPPQNPQPIVPDIPDIILVDLTVTSFNAPGCAAVGEAVGPQLEAVVRNTGTNDVNDDVPVGFYLSPEPVIAGFNTLLDGGREHLRGIDGLESKSVDISPGMAIPASYAIGQAHIGVKVDEFDAVAEADETNNTATVPIQIVAAPQDCP